MICVNFKQIGLILKKWVKLLFPLPSAILSHFVDIWMGSIPTRRLAYIWKVNCLMIKSIFVFDRRRLYLSENISFKVQLVNIYRLTWELLELKIPHVVWNKENAEIATKSDLKHVDFFVFSPLNSHIWRFVCSW